MTEHTPSLTTRRDFLRRTSALAALGGAAPWAFNLAAIGEAAAQQNPNDYKALVCVFLHGGLDHGNTLIPIDPKNHNFYRIHRGGLALPYSDLKPTSLLEQSPRFEQQYALAPSLIDLMPLWNSKQMCTLLNIGSLNRPTTKEDYIKKINLPSKLFSHNDQSSIWQALQTSDKASAGWGGNIAQYSNTNYQSSQFCSISISGNVVYVAGADLVPYMCTTNGPIAIKSLQAGNAPFKSLEVQKLLQRLITTKDLHEPSYFADAHVDIVQRSINANQTLTSALQGSPPFDDTGFLADNSLATQLKMVAKIINARGSIGVKRQVFFVSMGGFDHHDDLLARHGPMLSKVGSALSAFQKACVAMGVNDNVTSFTGSDFGRTFSSNGDGSDHGWGAHHFVVGGALKGGKGGQHVGTPPNIESLDGPDTVGSGRMLPSMATDQLARELALWMGVSTSDISKIIPNTGNFNPIGIFNSSPA